MIVLLGPKHCGKSETARALAALSGGPYIDLDAEIERRTGRTVRALYGEGAEVFRAAEYAALRALLESAPPGNAALAAGGGLIDNAPAMRLLAGYAGAARTVYVDVDAGTAWARIEAAAAFGGLPPFLRTDDPQKTHAELHERRAARYAAFAAFSVRAAGKSPARVAEEIARAAGLAAAPAPAVNAPAALVHPFPPLYDAASRVLVLGTMPSPASRANGFYYGHPRNRFWPVLAAVFGEDIPRGNAEKAALALRHGVALWDVLASCEIRGAADASIRKPAAQDIAAFLATTGIRRVFANGQKAAALYRRLCLPAAGIPAVALPSTSPANQRFPAERLVEIYRRHVGTR